MSGADAKHRASRPNVRVPFLDSLRGFAILAVFLYHSIGPSFGYHKVPFDPHDYYGKLGLTPNATSEDIRDAYQARGVEAQAAGLPMAPLEEARDILSDPERRKEYDSTRKWRDLGDAPRSYLPVVPFSFGAAGVAIFFVVSGYCIHVSHVRSGETNFRGFTVRRVMRIVPPYFVALIIFSFVYPWRIVLKYADGWEQFFSHLFLVHNFTDRTYPGINESFWSIAVESQLYLIYPLLLLMVTRRSWKYGLLVAAAMELTLRISAAWHLGTEPLPRIVIANPFAFWFSWSLGAWLAERHMAGEPLPLRSQSVWLWIVLAVASEFYLPWTSFSFLLQALATAVLLAKVLSDTAVFPRIPLATHFSRHLRFVGLVSYSLYLIHQPILKLVPELVRKVFPHVELHPLMMYAACVSMWPIVLFLSWLMYQWIELPSIQLGRRLVRRVNR